MFYIYILQSQITNKLYIGKTSNLKRRMKEHNSGQSTYTKKYLPWDIIYYEAHTDIDDAARREKYLKTTQGHQAIKRMLKAYFKSQSKMYFVYQGSTT